MSKLKVGIIGCGHISDTHIKSWKKTNNSEVVSVFDVIKDLVSQKAAKYNIRNISASIEEIVGKCDVLDVCTPPKTHFDIAMKVIDAGKHLLIEKPIVTDINEWEILKKAIIEKGIKFSVLHNLKFSLAVQNAKKLINEGKIGQLIRINRYFLTHPNQDRMLLANGHWSHNLPGGRWFETMPHELYITHFFAGHSTLRGVSVITSKNALPGAKAEEVCFVLENDKCISSYHYSSKCNLNKRYIEFIGTEGVIYIDVLSDMLFIDKTVGNRSNRGFGITFKDSLARIFQAFPDRVRYLVQRNKGISPHTRIILQFDAYLQGQEESPTPIEEVDFVVRNCDVVGKEIEKELLKKTKYMI